MRERALLLSELLNRGKQGCGEFGWNMPEPLSRKDPRGWELLIKTGAVRDDGVRGDVGPGVGVVI